MYIHNTHAGSLSLSLSLQSRESSMGLADSMWYMSMMTVSSGKPLSYKQLFWGKKRFPHRVVLRGVLLL